MTSSRNGPVLALITLFLASGEPRIGEAGPTVDTLSNGAIQVRGPAGGVWTESERWELRPIFRVGQVEGGGPEVFGEIWAVTADDQGRVYVLDRLAKEVRVFRPDGGFLRTIGRQGSGPGEFVEPFGFAWDPLGRLWVVDVRQARYSVFDSAGMPVREYRRQVGGYSWPWPGRIDPSGILYEPSFVAGGGLPILTFTLTEAELVAKDTFPNALAELKPADSWDLRDENRIGAIVSIPFGRRSDWTLDHAGSIWVGYSGGYRIIKRSLAGDTLLVIEREVAPPRVSTAERSAAIDRLGENARHPKMDLSLIPDTKPYFQRIIPDQEANTWVLREGEGSRWSFDVFRSDGAFLGTVSLPVPPELFPPPYITNDRVILVTRDSLDVQSVVAYRIDRRTAEPPR